MNSNENDKRDIELNRPMNYDFGISNRKQRVTQHNNFM